MSRTTTVAQVEYRLKLIGVLASAAGMREIKIESPEEIVLSHLVSLLLTRVNNRQFADLLIDSATDNPLPNVIILLNDQDCNLFDGLKTKLQAGTLVTIIPIAHGG